MNIEYAREFSPILGQEMEYKSYGHSGKPVIVFPTQAGRFYDYEGYGMIETCLPFIESGKLQFITVDSVDNQSWSNWITPVQSRANRHNEYCRYIIEEIIPRTRKANPFPGKFMVTGCGFGGYHAANTFFRFPDQFDALISLSGIFSLDIFIGDYMDDNVYFNSPLKYLYPLADEWYLQQYQNSKIILCAGQGAWEDRSLKDAYLLKRILDEKHISCWLDIWGHDVNHDWFWWQKMIYYFLDNYLKDTQS